MSWFEYSHYRSIRDQLNRIEAKLDLLVSKENRLMIDVASITAEVARNTDVEQSVLKVVQNLAAAVAAIPPSTDPTTQAALDALTATLKNNDDAIAAAVVANTSAAPAS